MPALRSQALDDDLPEIAEATQLVEDLARPTGLKTVAVEGIGLVMGLHRTGSDPPPSSRREVLINEMRTHRVHQPIHILKQPSTSLVLVRAFLRPGIQEGDPVDIEVMTPSRSTTRSLIGGSLLSTRLREIAVLNNQITQGNEHAAAKGHILVDSILDGEDDPVLLTRGKILGGGRSKTTRTLGLIVKEGHNSVRTSTQIGAAINRRFNFYLRGRKQGVAIPKRDDFIELHVHPRYRHSLIRYLHVIQSIPVRESASDRISRIELLKHELLNPVTSARAARRLEALGKEGEPILLEAIHASNEEVRFYAAEALAFLDRVEATPIIADTASRLPAFRRSALTALQAMDQPKAYDELTNLLHVESAETRYGAFRSLLELSPNDPMLKGEDLNQVITLHEISSNAPPMIHVSRHGRPEIVLFGDQVRFKSHLVLFAGPKITIRGDSDDRLKISRFSAKKQDVTRHCSTTVSDAVRTLVEVGATYPDIVQAIVQANRQGNLACRVEFDAVPRLGRTYHRDRSDEKWASEFELW